MDWLGLVIIVILAISMLSGLKEGLVRQVFDLLGLILALVLAIRYYDKVGYYLMKYFALSKPVANILGFALVCLVVVAAAAIVGAIWTRVVNLGPLSFLDRIGGAAFGLARGIVVVCIILIMFTALPFNEEVKEVVKRSPIARELLGLAPRLYGGIERIIPAGVPKVIVTPETITKRTY